MFEGRPIGVVHSELKNLEDCPLQESESAYQATIEIFDEFSLASEHINSGDSLVILTWLNKADRSVLKTHPRNNLKTSLTGVFSTRSPDRPNPIGLHIVSVVNVSTDKKQLEVSAMEVLDGTPVIDIKSQRTTRDYDNY